MIFASKTARLWPTRNETTKMQTPRGPTLVSLGLQNLSKCKILTCLLRIELAIKNRPRPTISLAVLGVDIGKEGNVFCRQ
jgi:hypothetical protein